MQLHEQTFSPILIYVKKFIIVGLIQHKSSRYTIGIEYYSFINDITNTISSKYQLFHLVTTSVFIKYRQKFHSLQVIKNVISHNFDTLP